MSVDQPFNIYREQLSSQYHGLALWDPKPVENLHKQPGHVSIGDVGYLDNGAFMRMFNVTLPWDDPSNNLLGKPEKYEHIKPGHLGGIRDNEIREGEYCTLRVSKVDNVGANRHEDSIGQMYQCGAQHRGALLSLPHKGHRKDVITLQVFRDYIRDNVDNWFRWSKKMKLPVEHMEDLILVTGCTLVTSWAAAAFDGHMSVDLDPTTISLEARKSDDGGAQYFWRNIRGSVEYHNSRFDPKFQEPVPQNQCVFIRGFRAKRTFFWTIRMRAAAEPLPDDPDDSREDEIQVTRIPDSSNYRDPLVGMLDYIIQKCNEDISGAKSILAIVHDNDLRFIEGVETLTADTVEKYLTEKQMAFAVENGSAFSLLDLVDDEPPVFHEKNIGRLSSDKSAHSKPIFTTQNLIDEYIGNIEARVVHEKDLEASHLEWLFGPDGNSPRSVGISPAYSQSGGFPAMACALDTRVLVINFHRSIPYRDGATGSGTVPRNVERRALLENELLCHPLCTLYSFDLAKIALSLHLHLHLHLTDAIDIQSALHIPDRSVVLSVRAVIADTCKIWTENIERAFENMIYRSSKHKDLTDLVQRAWLCSYIGRYDSEPIRDLFYKAPKVDTSTEKFSEDELNVLQKVAYDILRKDNMQPQTITHEFKTRWDPRKERMVAESQRYDNRLTRNFTRANITLAHGSDASFSVPGDASNVRGKNAGLDAVHNLEGKPITSITTTGRDAPMQAELDCDNTILSMLQGQLPLLDGDWMKAIWLPSEPVVWSFTPPPDAPAIEIISHPKAPLNTSQCSAISKMVSSSLDDNITLIQGPPGTGKTTVIATYVLSMIKARQGGIWLMAQSNVAVKNIAEKLAMLDFFDFKLLISHNFYFGWHEHPYRGIKENIIVSDKFTKSGFIHKALQGTQVILCTLDMISNPKLQRSVTQAVPIVNVVIDEASQTEVGQYIPLFNNFGKSLRKICFVGDDKRLPPHGQDDLHNLQSIFELEHLRKSLSFLDTQYRMPPQIGEFISQQVYDSLLLSDERHVVPSSTIACRFIDVDGLERLDKDGKGFYNEEEVDAIVLLAKHLQDENVSFRIITPYDAQRSALEQALKDEDLDWEDKCFNIDSFQGNEDHIIIISVVRSKGLGILTDMRRTNVMLTRCQRAMYIVSSRTFLEGKGADSLVGKMAAELGQRPGAWLTHEDLEDGKFE